MPASISITVNTKSHMVESEMDRSLLEVLREDLQMTGTKYGCGEGACGACSVLADGKRIFSCSTTLGEVVGKSIVTIEGIGSGIAPGSGSSGTLHPVQQAFLDERAFQCGYCTSGMIVNSVAMLKNNPNPNESDIRAAMNGNICRCCTYPRIISAIQHAVELAKETANAK